MEKTKETQQVAIPKDMAENIKRVVSSRLGYVTMAEYVRQAVRDKLQSDMYKLEELEDKIKKELSNDDES